MIKSDPEFSKGRSAAVIVVAVLLLGVAANAAIQKAKPPLAARYETKGIAFLKEQQFEQAAREFARAETLGRKESAVWEQWAKDAPTDPKVLEYYWRFWDIPEVTAKLDQALTPFTEPKAALAQGIALYSAGEPQYAQYAIDRALELDPKYPEAWHYRYLTYLKLAEQNARYREQAEQARQERDRLTSLYLNP